MTLIIICKKVTCSSDLGAVLQHRDRELGAGHAGQPQAEVTVNFVPINLLDESLQRRHPGGSEMAVLEEHPAASIHGFLHHSLSTRTLEGKRVSEHI